MNVSDLIHQIETEIDREEYPTTISINIPAPLEECYFTVQDKYGNYTHWQIRKMTSKDMYNPDNPY